MAQLYGCTAANDVRVAPGSHKRGKADIKAMVAAAGPAPGRRRAYSRCSSASVRACNSSKLSPGIMSITTKPFGVTSSTARLV
jgi:hypothetical protein